MSTLFFSFHFPFADHNSSSIIPHLLNTNHPPSISSITDLKTRPKASRRVHSVSINSLASYSTWYRCLFALVDRALKKARQSYVNPFSYISTLVKTSKLSPATLFQQLPWARAPGQTFDRSPLGSQHTLTLGGIPLLALSQNGSFASFISLYHKLTLQGSLQAKTCPICAAASVHYRRLRGKIGLDLRVRCRSSCF